MINPKDFLEVGMTFHGHKCPAMPLGLRAGAAAMNKLGVARSQDKALKVISETGKGHAAGCFLDGIMTISGCTYGKSNIQKLYYNKMAFTLIDVEGKKSIRVSLKPEFFANMLKSPFVEKRKAGILPQDISPEIADPLVEKIMGMPEEKFLDFGEIKSYEPEAGKGCFEAKPCSKCKELVFVNKLTQVGSELVCQGCLK